MSILCCRASPRLLGAGRSLQTQKNDDYGASVQKNPVPLATVSPAEGVCVGVDAGAAALGADWGGGAECSAATSPEEDQTAEL